MDQEFELSDGDVRIWIEQESLHMRALDAHGDPVELTKKEALVLADALIRLAKSIE